MESQLLLAFRHIAANDKAFSLKVLADFGKFVNDVTEADLHQHLDAEAIAMLEKYAEELRRRQRKSVSRIRRKGGRP